ncbi:MAG TPA: hypothetical protein VG939_13290 [Caulobacteraceae bacterium]|nr:hypothetical protein [Caulobacteraceae bacterium]
MKTFLALYTGSPNPDARPSPPDPDTIARGMAAWSGWMAANADRLAFTGGPLGATKTVDKTGIADTHNAVAGFVVIQAEDHAAAARLFENHPHFAIFPGEAVEIMEVLPVPGS